MNIQNYLRKSILILILFSLPGCYKSFWSEPQQPKPISKTHQKLKKLDHHLKNYYELMGTYPRSLTRLVRGPSDVSLKKQWVSVSQDLLIDEWGNRFIYRVRPGLHPPYELYSMGSRYTR